MSIAPRPLDSTPAFLDEASAIQGDITRFNNNVMRIPELNDRILGALDADDAQPKAELDTLVDETRVLSNSIRDRIQRLRDATGSNEIRRNRVKVLGKNFMDGVQTYQSVERESRKKSRARIERQYAIVKPDATQDEIDAAVNSGGDQVFLQALSSSTRYGESRQAYKEVTARAQDLKRMEQTLVELGQLFSDMALLVEQQDIPIVTIEKTAGDIEKDAEKAADEVGVAVVIARNLRKKRWICFFICLVVVVILAAVLAVEIPKHN